MKKMISVFITISMIVTGMFILISMATPSLRASSPTLDWDNRLNALNVTYQAAADCSQGCWRLVSARYQDEQESQGLHHIWGRALNEFGSEIEGQTWYVAWPEDSQSLTTKPAGEWADYPMFSCYNPDNGPGGYRAWMGSNSAQSDQVAGMGLPQCLHVSFRLIWQWDSGGETPTATPIPAQATSTSTPIQVIPTSQAANTATPVGNVATATATAFVPPTAIPQPLQWDSRFDELNVSYHPAANCSQGCWRLVSALYEDPNQSGGAHHIFARMRDQSGSLLSDAPWHAAWPDGDVRIMTKAEPDWADYAIFACYDPTNETGGYRAYAGDVPSQSDHIYGMGLPQCQHVNFRLIWQWDEGGETPTPPPTHTPSPTSSPTITLTPSPTSSPTIRLTPSPTSSPSITPTPDPNVVPRLWIPLIVNDPFIPPTMTPTPIPTVSIATSTPTTIPSTGGMMFGGEIMERFTNCSLTQVFGTVQRANGQPLVGPRLRLTWNGSNGVSYHTNAGLHVRPETDASGWEFTLNSNPVENRWRVAVVDALDNLLSEEVEVQTDGNCSEGAANVIKMRFFIQDTSPATATPTSTTTPISAEMTATPTSSATPISSGMTATPTPIPSPTPTPAGSGMAFSGEIVQTFTNCGLTQIFGVVHDANGQPLPNTRLRLTWDAADAQTIYITAGQYVRPETDESGWEFFLNSRPVANVWRLALVDDSEQLISDDISVYTEGHCNGNAVNVVKVRFYMP